MYLRKLLLGILVVVTLQSCNSDDDNKKNDEGNDASTFTKISELINFKNVKTDTLSFNPGVYSEVVGTQGTTIMISENSIKPKGTTAVPNKLFVVLREYLTVNAMVKSGVKTMSGDKVLVTGGNFWWDIVDAEGNQWELKNDASVNARQPIVTDMGSYLYDSRYFVGTVKEEQGNEVIDWDLDDNSDSFASRLDGNNDFPLFLIDRLKIGWANCDIFYDIDAVKTQLKAKIISNVKLKPNNSKLIFIPKKFPSVISSYSVADNHFSISGVPVGIEGLLVSVALSENDKFLIGSKVINVQEGVVNEIQLEYGKKEDFAHLIDNYIN